MSDEVLQRVLAQAAPDDDDEPERPAPLAVAMAAAAPSTATDMIQTMRARADTLRANLKQADAWREELALIEKMLAVAEAK